MLVLSWGVAPPASSDGIKNSNGVEIMSDVYIQQIISAIDERLIVDVEAGTFKWKPGYGKGRPSSDGTPGGVDTKTGMRKIRILGKLHNASRLIWIYHYKEQPEENIKHINKDPSDDRLSNLYMPGRKENGFICSHAAQKAFWSKVNKDGPVKDEELGPCWVWEGGISQGYGVHNHAGSRWRTHRLGYYFQTGKDPRDTDLRVLHKCNNKACVRAEHLYLGTHAENMRDHFHPGREVMTIEKAEEMRSLYRTGKYSKAFIGKKYGFSFGQVGRILRNETWNPT